MNYTQHLNAAEKFLETATREAMSQNGNTEASARLIDNFTKLAQTHAAIAQALAANC